MKHRRPRDAYQTVCNLLHLTAVQLISKSGESQSMAVYRITSAHGPASQTRRIDSPGGIRPRRPSGRAGVAHSLRHHALRRLAGRGERRCRDSRRIRLGRTVASRSGGARVHPSSNTRAEVPISAPRFAIPCVDIRRSPRGAGQNSLATSIRPHFAALAIAAWSRSVWSA